MVTSQIQVYEILKKAHGEESAKMIVTFIEQKAEEMANESATKTALAETELRLSNKMDAHFKWLVGVMISTISIATVLSKLL